MSLFSADKSGGKGKAKGGGGAKRSIIVQFDGGSRGNPGPAGIGVVVSDETGDAMYELGEYLGICTNNVAEYTALVRGLNAAKGLGATHVTVRADSELVVRQINGIYKVKSPDLKPLFHQAVGLIEAIGNVKVVHVYREKNTRADELANMAMDRGGGGGVGSKIEPLGPIGGFPGGPRSIKKSEASSAASADASLPVRAVDGLMELRRQIRILRQEPGDLTLREMEALLLVAESPGRTLEEISQAMEMSHAAVYRAVVEGLVLNQQYALEEQGSGDYASRGFFLTKKGFDLVERVVAVIKATAESR